MLLDDLVEMECAKETTDIGRAVVKINDVRHSVNNTTYRGICRDNHSDPRCFPTI